MIARRIVSGWRRKPSGAMSAGPYVSGTLIGEKSNTFSFAPLFTHSIGAFEVEHTRLVAGTTSAGGIATGSATNGGGQSIGGAVEDPQAASAASSTMHEAIAPQHRTS